MVDVNATRLCVVCGVMFVRQHKRVYCSDACAIVGNRRSHKESAISVCNIAPACKECNDRKGPKDFITWVNCLELKHKQRAIKFFEKRNGSLMQLPIRLAA